MSVKIASAFVGMILTFASGTSAALAAQIAINETSPGLSYSGSPYTLGFEFSPTTNISVTALGTFDNGAALISPAQVGIWNLSGTLLTSTTVPTTGAILNGLFAYQAITPFALTAGTDYIIGSYDTGVQSSLNTGQSGVGTIDPSINVIVDKFVSSGAFSFPNSTDNFSGGAWLGADFQFVSTTTSVPEPLTLSLFGAGVAGVVAMRRRNKAKA